MFVNRLPAGADLGRLAVISYNHINSHPSLLSTAVALSHALIELPSIVVTVLQAVTESSRTAVTALRTVTDNRTTAPPTSAQAPGFSPIAKRTQTGFKIGSIVASSIASRAVICLMAVVYRRYGRPS